MTTLDLQVQRTKLVDKLDMVLRRTGAVEKHLRGGDGRNEADFSDRVAFTEMDEVLEALDDAGRLEIDLIKGALDRIEAGTYGVCVRCGAPVGDRRLEVLPEAALCTNCAAATGG